MLHCNINKQENSKKFKLLICPWRRQQTRPADARQTPKRHEDTSFSQKTRETWAHDFHMIDTLETASAFGLRIRPLAALGADLTAAINLDPYSATMDHIIACWLPLTFAVNSIIRSMGVPDPYPFVLSPLAIEKLAFIRDFIRTTSGRRDPIGAQKASRAFMADT